LGCFTLTAGGEFHPALRTSAARNERPEVNYGEPELRQQGLHHWKSTCRHVPTAKPEGLRKSQKLTIMAAEPVRLRESDSGLFSC